MGYELALINFIDVVEDISVKKILNSFRLPDNDFFGGTEWKKPKKKGMVIINIAVKTTKKNVQWISKRHTLQVDGAANDLVIGTSKIRFIVSRKARVNRNAGGAKLANAGEKATIQSLQNTIKSAHDTGEQYFIKDDEAYQAWSNTFKATPAAIKLILKDAGGIGGFKILHDATNTSQFSVLIKEFLKVAKLSKDSWNPADIYIIKNESMITRELRRIVDTYSVKDGLISMFNAKMYEFYNDKMLYPISLKQVVSKDATIEYNNRPNAKVVKDYNIQISNFICKLGPPGKDIGSFNFDNEDTKKKIRMQIRGFPHTYGIAQTEIISDGTPTGGRLGKIPTGMVDRVMGEYGDLRIREVTGFFGNKQNAFSKFDAKRIAEVYSWYKTVSLHPKVSADEKMTPETFTALIEEAQGDYYAAENLCMKIQGLKMMHFFIKNEKDISPIMNKMINAAKKIGGESGFFIKIS